MFYAIVPHIIHRSCLTTLVIGQFGRQVCVDQTCKVSDNITSISVNLSVLYSLERRESNMNFFQFMI